MRVNNSKKSYNLKLNEKKIISYYYCNIFFCFVRLEYSIRYENDCSVSFLNLSRNLKYHDNNNIYNKKHQSHLFN